MTNRRRLLSALATVGLAGCASRLPSATRTQLGSVTVSNYTDSERTIDVRIAADGDSVSESTHRLEAGASSYPTTEELPCEWPSEPSAFVIEARRAGADWQTLEVGERSDGDCTAVDVRARDEGGVVTFSVHECAELAAEYGCEFLE